MLLSVVVDETGKAVGIKITKSLGLGLDEKAIECVKKWRWKPGTFRGPKRWHKGQFRAPGGDCHDG